MLLVAIVIVLVAVLGVFVVGLNDTEDDAQAGVQIEQTQGGVQVRIIDSGNTEEVQVRLDGSVVETLDSSGESTTIATSNDASVTIVGVTSDGNNTVLDQFEAKKDTTGGGGGGGSDPISSPSSSAPDCSTISYEESGNSSDPYKVSNDKEFQCMNQDLGASYKLTQDTDASKTDQWNGGSGFKPVGSDSNRFVGTFNGQDYTIDGLYIDRSSNDNGLFGFTSSGATITKVGLTNITVSGDRRSGGLVGTLKNDGNTSESYAKGTVSSNRKSGGLSEEQLHLTLEKQRRFQTLMQ